MHPAWRRVTIHCMETVRSIDIDAPPGAVWNVLADVARWPSWTASVKKAELVEGEMLGRNAKARLDILGAPAGGTWTVTVFNEGREFCWENRAPGVHTIASHIVEPRDGGSHVTLGVHQSGPGAWLLWPWLRHVNSRNLRMESEGLKRAAEASAARS